MKKRTCKVLLYMGVVLLGLSFIYSMVVALWPVINKASSPYDPLVGLLYSLLNPVGFAGAILIIISITKWNSEDNPIKKKEYWLEGGIWGEVIGLMLWFISMAVIGVSIKYFIKCAGDICNLPLVGTIGLVLFNLLIWPAKFFLSSKAFSGMHIWVYRELAILLPLLKVFIIGALVGLIIGKIKKSSQIA